MIPFHLTNHIFYPFLDVNYDTVTSFAEGTGMFAGQEGGIAIKKGACNGDITCPIMQDAPTIYNTTLRVLDAFEVNLSIS